MAVDFVAALNLRQKNPYLAKLLEEGMSTAPIQSHWQGAARLANALLGGVEMGRENARTANQEAGVAETGDIVARHAAGGAPQGPVSMPMPAQPGPTQPMRPTTANPYGRPGGGVASTNRVMGDQEAQAAGIYEGAPLASPTQPGAAPVQTQSFRPQQAPQQAPVQMAQRVPEPMPAHVQDMIRSKNSVTRALGLNEATKILGREPKSIVFQDTGTSIIGFDPISGRPLTQISKDVEGAEAAKGRGTLQNAGAIKSAETLAEGRAKMQLGKEGTREGDIRSGGVVVQDIDRGIKIIDKAPNWTTGPVGEIFKHIPATEANQLSGLLTTIKANAGFQQLQAMRQASPTGGALGNVTEQEMKFLQAAVGDLEQSRGGPMLKDNMNRVKNIFLDVIHGPGNGPPRAELSFNKGAPKPGHTEGGWRFKGGDPSKQENWERAR